MVKNPYPGGNPGGVLNNPNGPKPGKRSDQGVVGMPGTKKYAPAPDRNVGNSPNTSSDLSYTNAAWETPWARPKGKSSGKPGLMK